MTWWLWAFLGLFLLGSEIVTPGRLMTADRGNVSSVDTMGGETAIVLDDLPPGATGKAECRGSTWNAHNAGDKPLLKGQRSLVDRVDGITLWIKPE